MLNPKSKEDLKQILKPLIKETVKEVILESGVLSKIISEVLEGVKGSLIIESRSDNRSSENISQEKNEHNNKQKRQLSFEQRNERNEILAKRQETSKVFEKTGMPQVFENLVPMGNNSVTLTTESAKNDPSKFQAAAEKNGTALRGIDPNDPGININGILDIIGGTKTWTNQLKKMKGK